MVSLILKLWDLFLGKKLAQKKEIQLVRSICRQLLALWELIDAATTMLESEPSKIIRKAGDGNRKTIRCPDCELPLTIEDLRDKYSEYDEG